MRQIHIKTGSYRVLPTSVPVSMDTVYTYYTNGQATLGTDKQLVLVFALVNKLEGAPAAWIQKAGRWT